MGEYQNKIYKINRLTTELDALYRKAASVLKISDSVLFTLYIILEKGGECLLSQISEEAGLCKQTVNSTLRKLEKEELLYLEKINGKSKKACLTDKGKAFAQQTAKRVFKAECDAFLDWTDEETDLYIHLMEKYNKSLEKQIEKLKERDD